MGYHEFEIFKVNLNVSQKESKWIKNVLTAFEYIEEPFETNQDGDYVYDYNKNDVITDEYELHFAKIMFLYSQHQRYDESNIPFPCFRFDIFEKEVLFYNNIETNETSLQVAIFIHYFLNFFNKDDVIKFRWVCWDNRGKDVYNGGIYLITKDSIKEIDLKYLLDKETTINDPNLEFSIQEHFE